MKIRRLFNVLCIISFRFLLRTIRNRFRVETCHVTNPEVLKMRMNMICLNVGDYDTIAFRFCLKMSKFEGKIPNIERIDGCSRFGTLPELYSPIRILIFTTNLIKINTFLLEINNLPSKFNLLAHQTTKMIKIFIDKHCGFSKTS